MHVLCSPAAVVCSWRTNPSPIRCGARRQPRPGVSRGWGPRRPYAAQHTRAAVSAAPAGAVSSGDGIIDETGRARLPPDGKVEAQACGKRVVVFGVDHRSRGTDIADFIREHTPSHVVMETSIGHNHGSAWCGRLQVNSLTDPEVAQGDYWVQSIASLGLRIREDMGNAAAVGVLADQMLSEQLGAVMGIAVGATLVFGDRPKDETYRRLLSECTVEDLDEAFARQSAHNYLETLTKDTWAKQAHGPAERVLLDERDLCLAAALAKAAEEASSDVVVGIMGTSHLPGETNLAAVWPPGATQRGLWQRRQAPRRFQCPHDRADTDVSRHLLPHPFSVVARALLRHFERAQAPASASPRPPECSKRRPEDAASFRGRSADAVEDNFIAFIGSISVGWLCCLATRHGSASLSRAFVTFAPTPSALRWHESLTSIRIGLPGREHALGPRDGQGERVQGPHGRGDLAWPAMGPARSEGPPEPSGSDHDCQSTHVADVRPRTTGICRVRRGLLGFYREQLVVLKGGDLQLFPLGADPHEVQAEAVVQLSGAYIKPGGPGSFVIREGVSKRVSFRCPPHERDEWLVALMHVGGLTRRIADFYTLGNALGEGATCRVFEATCKITGRRVAIKTRLDPSSFDALKALHNEVKMLELCNRYPHPAIPKALDFFYDPQGGLHLVTELMDGGELFTRIVQRDHLSEAEARSVFRQVVEGVAHLHSLSIAHRDLKPENLMFAHDPETGEEVLKIVDFDLARLDTSAAWTGDTPCGTLSYMAPEIVSRRRYSQAVDMWSLGCILYILLSGRKPFGGATEEARKENIKRAKVCLAPQLFEGVSESAKDLIKALLVKNPADRLTAKEVLRHRWLQEGHGAMSRWLPTPHMLKDALSPAALLALQDRKNGEHHAARKDLYSNRGTGNIGTDAVRQADDPHPDDHRVGPGGSPATLLNLFGLVPLVTGYMGTTDNGAAAHLTAGQEAGHVAPRASASGSDGASSSGSGQAGGRSRRRFHLHALFSKGRSSTDSGHASKAASPKADGDAPGHRYVVEGRQHQLDAFKMRCELGAGPPVVTSHRMSVDRGGPAMSPSPSTHALMAMACVL